jgi:hypothetical protein
MGYISVFFFLWSEKYRVYHALKILSFSTLDIQYRVIHERGIYEFFLPQPIIHIATISSFQILKIIITESTTVLSPVSLTLKQKIFVN